VCFNGRKFNLSGVFAGQEVGVRGVEENLRLVSLMHYDLGFFDYQGARLECAANTSAPKCYL
jgi:putative transposase